MSLTPEEALEAAIANARLSGWELPPEWRQRLLDAAISKEKLADFRRELLAEMAREVAREAPADTAGLIDCRCGSSCDCCCICEDADVTADLVDAHGIWDAAIERMPELREAQRAADAEPMPGTTVEVGEYLRGLGERKSSQS